MKRSAHVSERRQVGDKVEDVVLDVGLAEGAAVGLVVELEGYAGFGDADGGAQSERGGGRVSFKGGVRERGEGGYLSGSHLLKKAVALIRSYCPS